VKTKIAAVGMTFLLFCLVGTSAVAAKPSNGVMHACLAKKGKKRGSLRVVSGPSSCKKRRGERYVAWQVRGPAGARGANGPQGQAGPRGIAGPAGWQGTAGQIEKSTLETIQAQTSELKVLNEEVTTLTQELTGVEEVVSNAVSTVSGLEANVTDLEGTVASTCGQLTAVTSQVDEVGTAVTGLSLNGTLTGLGGVLEVPAMPAPLTPYTCP
jgi:hypothetical protein